MVAKQRAIAAEASNVVMEGRDIGSVVFPQAQVKIFLDADSGERTRRRVSTNSAPPPIPAKSPNSLLNATPATAPAPKLPSPKPPTPSISIPPISRSNEVIEALLKIVRAKTANGKAYH